MCEETLFDLPEPVAPKVVPPTRPEDARLLRAVRDQVEWLPRSLDACLPQEHPARDIWKFVQGLPL